MARLSPFTRLGARGQVHASSTGYGARQRPTSAVEVRSSRSGGASITTAVDQPGGTSARDPGRAGEAGRFGSLDAAKAVGHEWATTGAQNGVLALITG